MAKTCPACGKRQGSNAGCLSCRDAAARELAAQARDVTVESMAGRAARVGGWLARRPWYAASAPRGVVSRLRLFWLLATDFVHGRYVPLSWRALAAVAAAAAYVLMPFDLIPDFLGPIGFVDDALVLGLAFGLARRELRRYCEWKGLSPAHFGLEPR